jgi:hypothetical protein
VLKVSQGAPTFEELATAFDDEIDGRTTRSALWCFRRHDAWN